MRVGRSVASSPFRQGLGLGLGKELGFVFLSYYLGRKSLAPLSSGPLWVLRFTLTLTRTFQVRFGYYDQRGLSVIPGMKVIDFVISQVT